MTRVERETLLALNHLGRKAYQPLHTITNVRLKIRHTGSKRWDATPWGHRPSMTNQELGQYYSVTEKWLKSFVHRGLAEIQHPSARAGAKLILHFGPMWRISKEGQKQAKVAS